ncbi:MAG: hypothetical protein ACW98F_06835 [Candidatus Hodarchaeales archaeon]|jgi:hypothetical protein
MRRSNFPLRILLIGRETGPFAQLLKNSHIHSNIGSVDVLGNMETRIYSDWKFSVIKQEPGSSLVRKKKKSTVDILFELATIMLEEKKFDILIPLAPFHKFPDLIKHFSNLCEITITTQASLEKTSSDCMFIKYLIEEFPQFIPYYNRIKIKKVLDENREGMVITDVHKVFIKSETKDENYKELATEGFFLPLKEIHCAGFFSTNESVLFLGFQTLKSPDGFNFINKDLEKNAYYPCNEETSFMKELSNLIRIIEKLNLVGLISIYFGIIENKIVPFSCNVLPDENIDLWMNKTNNNFIPHFLKFSKDLEPFSRDSLFGYKIPIYSQLSSVPAIPPELATQRNLPGISAHFKYPICAIFGALNTYQNVKREILEKKEIIHKILGNFNP